MLISMTPYLLTLLAGTYRQSQVILNTSFLAHSNKIPFRGYAEKEGDARRYHPKLRPPVDPRELEIDSRTGMKVCGFLPFLPRIKLIA